jgi:hypothetical protein
MSGRTQAADLADAVRRIVGIPAATLAPGVLSVGVPPDRWEALDDLRAAGYLIAAQDRLHARVSAGTLTVRLVLAPGVRDVAVAAAHALLEFDTPAGGEPGRFARWLDDAEARVQAGQETVVFAAEFKALVADTLKILAVGPFATPLSPRNKVAETASQLLVDAVPRDCSAAAMLTEALNHRDLLRVSRALQADSARTLDRPRTAPGSGQHSCER